MLTRETKPRWGLALVAPSGALFPFDDVAWFTEEGALTYARSLSPRIELRSPWRLAVLDKASDDFFPLRLLDEQGNVSEIVSRR